MEILFLALLFLGGVFGGFFGSTVGSAGLISLPLLILIGLSPHLAVATSRPSAFILELVSAVRFYREGKLDAKLLKRGLLLGLAGAVGAVIGAKIIATVSDQTLRLLFAIVISSMFLFLLTRKSWGLTEHRQRQGHHIFLAFATLLVGIYGGFFGFTFGTFITFVLVAFGYTLLQSAALGRTIGAVTALAAAAVFAIDGTIHWPYAIVLGAGFAIGAWWGADVGAKKGSTYIKTLLFLVVIGSVAKLLFDYFLSK